MLKKLFVFLLLTTYYLMLTASPAYAQSPTPSVSSLPGTILPTSPFYTDLLVHNLFHSFSCLAVGQSVIGQPCLTYQFQKNAQGMLQGIPVLAQTNLSGGTLGAVTSVIGAMYQNPPVRTADYLASVGQDFGIVRQANAQVVGSGAQVLNPILRLWEVSRNISYVIMIVIFVVIGVMVMFRNRINPQTVITAQAALPGLVIGLIMITFSYFLAGLISDMAFVGTNIVGYYFSTARGESTPQNLVQNLDSPGPNGRKPNLISIFSNFATTANKEKVTAVLNSFWNDINDDAQRLLVTLAAFISAQITGQVFEGFKLIPKFGEGIIAVLQGIAVFNTLTGPIGPTAVVGALLAFVVTAVLLYAMFKLLFRLISVYLSIIFLTITAPFQFLAASLPGRQGIATAWILNMLANILAFPAVIAVFYFVAFILGPANGPYYPFKVSNAGETPMASNSLVSTVEAQGPVEITGPNNFPLFGGISLDFVKLLLAFGALVATPAIPDILIRIIGSAGVAGQLVGQEIGGGIAAGRGYGQQAQQGVGAASGNLARARGLFNTPGYELYDAGVDDAGRPIRGIREVYQPGVSYSFGALAKSDRVGGFVRRITGGRIGGIPKNKINP